MLPAQSASSSSSSSDKGQGTFVRRFSIGATLSVLGLSPLSGSSTAATPISNATTTVITSASTTPASSRIGYGLTAQVAITDHFAVAVGGYLRRLAYSSSSSVTTNATTFINGTSTTTTTTTSTNTRVDARLLDVPFALRYYGRGRHTPGPRWFVEGGGAWRDTPRLSSSRSTTDNSGALSCCTTNVVQPAHRRSRGFLGGAGAQFIDPFGIRVVPEIRYTRWISPIFDDPTTRTQRNQVEAALSLSF